MQSFCFYLLPFFALFNTLLSCYLVYRVALASPRWRKTFFETFAEFVSQQEDMTSLRSLLEQRYDGFIDSLKRRIPMAEMVMNGPLEASLKEQIQTEIDKLLPELKARLLQNPLQLDPFLAKLQRQYQLKIILSLAAISLSFGLVQLLLFLVFC